MVKAVLFDLSGVLYTGKEALPGALDAIERLMDAGVPMRYVTNTTRSPRHAILAKLTAMGFQINESDLFTAPIATHEYLSSHKLSPHLLVHPDLEQDFADLPDKEPNAVLLGDAGEAFTYENMNKAFRLLMEGAPLLAMGKNQYFKEADGFSLDAGPYVVALEFAANTEAMVIGKPARAFFNVVVSSLGCLAEDVVMVGDDVKSDVIGGLDAGLQGILVKTGKYRNGDEGQLHGRGLCVEDVSAVADYILENFD
jgi:HAD superfamily hydrolase (TIGR01458 family)